MSENQDIRWVQRLSNYDKAVTRLQLKSYHFPNAGKMVRD